MKTIDQLKDSLWRLIRKYYLTKYLYCQICVCQQSQDVHHIVKKSLSEYLRFDSKNFIAICRGCHSKIHAYHKQHSQFEDTEMCNILLRLISEDGINYLELNKRNIKNWSHYELEDLIQEYKTKIKELDNG